MNPNTNPLGWLPKPGEKRPVPGGYIWCEETEVNYERDELVSGRIVFRFVLTGAAYDEAMAAPKQLNEPPKAIEDKQREER